ncbi:RICIN domain-containing protein [Deinococcus sp.]|uniref:RICIN domain-containing protein n=1 Tax=Deinococcus sp. TaxID=47478 RepID=UPI003B5A7D50
MSKWTSDVRLSVRLLLPALAALLSACGGSSSPRGSVSAAPDLGIQALDTPGVIYQLLAKHSGLALSAPSSQSGVQLQQATPSNSAAQQWTLKAVGGGYYQVVSKLSGQVMDVAQEQVTQNGAKVSLWPYSQVNLTNKQWKIEAVSGAYKLVNKASGKVLDVSRLSKSPGAPVLQWDYAGQANQLWMLKAVSSPPIVTPPAPAVPEWVVAPGGSDSNDGSSARPFATVQKALDAVQPGQNVLIRRGTYNLTRAAYLISKRGTAAKPILIRGEPGAVLRDPSRIISPFFGTEGNAINYYWGTGLLSVLDSSYVTVQGLRAENSGWFGFRAWKVDHFTLQDSSSSSSLASAIYIGADNDKGNSTNVVVRRNDVTSFCDDKELVRGMGCQEGISLVGLDGFEVADNKVHDSIGHSEAWGGGEGIDAKNGTSNGKVHHNEIYNLSQLAIYVDGYSFVGENIDIYANHIHNTHDGIRIDAEQTGSVKNIRIHDNLIRDIGYWGINAGVGEVSVYNNTVVRSGLGRYKAAFCERGPDGKCADYGSGLRVAYPQRTNAFIHDNIVVDSVTYPIEYGSGAPGTSRIENNLVFPARGGPQNLGSKSIVADPLFVNTAGNDFHLKAGSPAIGKSIGGSPLGKDYDGKTRPASPIDLGAFSTR